MYLIFYIGCVSLTFIYVSYGYIHNTIIVQLTLYFWLSDSLYFWISDLPTHDPTDLFQPNKKSKKNPVSPTKVLLKNKSCKERYKKQQELIRKIVLVHTPEKKTEIKVMY